jgi:hypothetical protein
MRVCALLSLPHTGLVQEATDDMLTVLIDAPVEHMAQYLKKSAAQVEQVKVNWCAGVCAVLLMPRFCLLRRKLAGPSSHSVEVGGVLVRDLSILYSSCSTILLSSYRRFLCSILSILSSYCCPSVDHLPS